jgi:hypothetical protein
MEQDVLYFGRSLKDTRGAFRAPELQLFSDLLGQVESLYGKRLQSLKLVGSRARGTAMDTSEILISWCFWTIAITK